MNNDSEKDKNNTENTSNEITQYSWTKFFVKNAEILLKTSFPFLQFSQYMTEQEQNKKISDITRNLDKEFFPLNISDTKNSGLTKKFAPSSENISSEKNNNTTIGPK